MLRQLGGASSVTLPCAPPSPPVPPTRALAASSSPSGSSPCARVPSPPPWILHERQRCGARVSNPVSSSPSLPLPLSRSGDGDLFLHGSGGGDLLPHGSGGCTLLLRGSGGGATGSGGGSPPQPRRWDLHHGGRGRVGAAASLHHGAAGSVRRHGDPRGGVGLVPCERLARWLRPWEARIRRRWARQWARERARRRAPGFFCFF